MASLTEMQAFTETVRGGSFSAAARLLDLSPSAISKLVTRLEQRLETRLLNRTTRRISLTEAGQSYYQRCNEILSEIDDAEAEIKALGALPTGILRVNCSAGFARHQLLPLLPRFHAAYPDLEIDLSLTGKVIDLLAEGADLAIRLGALADSSLIASPLGQSLRIVCASPSYLKHNERPKSPQDLKQHNCLCLSSREDLNRWLFSKNQESETITVRGNFKTDNVNVLLDYALAGGGIIRLSGFMLRNAIAQKQLIPLLEDYQTQTQWVNVVYPHRRFLPEKVRVFIEFLQTHLKVDEW